MKTSYVVCLLFNIDLTKLVLITKNRPQWQAGLLNGPGGKIEPGETVIQAAVREFKEETGLEITDWTSLCSTEGPDYIVYFLTASKSMASSARSLTDEAVGHYVHPVKGVVPGLEWLIPLAVYKLSGRMENEQCMISMMRSVSTVA